MNDLSRFGGAIRCRVLLVDDDPWMLRIMRASLPPDAAVVTCASGEEALRVLETEEMDVVCSDLRMPGMSGDELLRVVADAHGAPGLLLVTGRADAGDVDADAGYEVLMKPFDPRIFAAIVGRLAEAAIERSASLAQGASRPRPRALHARQGGAR